MNFLILFVALSASAFATEKTMAKATKTEVAAAVVTGVVISVKGMVCSFCAQGIEKKLKAFKEVRSVNVDLDTKKVNIQFVLGQTLSEKILNETIKNAGYEVTELKLLGMQQ
jgi:copper chaperone CopZ